jgi:hypothetical protein
MTKQRTNFGHRTRRYPLDRLRSMVASASLRTPSPALRESRRGTRGMPVGGCNARPAQKPPDAVDSCATCGGCGMKLPASFQAQHHRESSRCRRDAVDSDSAGGSSAPESTAEAIGRICWFTEHVPGLRALRVWDLARRAGGGRRAPLSRFRTAQEVGYRTGPQRNVQAGPPTSMKSVRN